MSTQTLNGSCLCGAVRYSITGEAQKFYHCHCKRCRKATGTGHASLIIFDPCKLTWTQGEALLKRYKVPEAERFGTVFCTSCGSGLPRYSAESGRAVVPAGSLDDEAGIQPQARIFWDSRTGWSCAGDDIPVYSEYPE